MNLHPLTLVLLVSAVALALAGAGQALVGVVLAVAFLFELAGLILEASERP